MQAGQSGGELIVGQVGIERLASLGEILGVVRTRVDPHCTDLLGVSHEQRRHLRFRHRLVADHLASDHARRQQERGQVHH